MIKDVRINVLWPLKGNFVIWFKAVVTGISEKKGKIVSPVTLLMLSRCNVS
jgi:hypothetical protein